MQLMHQNTPWATGLLAVLGPMFEPVGFLDPTHFCYCFDLHHAPHLCRCGLALSRRSWRLGACS